MLKWLTLRIDLANASMIYLLVFGSIFTSHIYMKNIGCHQFRFVLMFEFYVLCVCISVGGWMGWVFVLYRVFLFCLALFVSLVNVFAITAFLNEFFTHNKVMRTSTYTFSKWCFHHLSEYWTLTLKHTRTQPLHTASEHSYNTIYARNNFT